jgi:hypothetical protein
VSGADPSRRVDIPVMVWLLKGSDGRRVSQERIRSLAASPDLIVPGHDPAVFERYTRVADGIVRIR